MAESVRCSQCASEFDPSSDGGRCPSCGAERAEVAEPAVEFAVADPMETTIGFGTSVGGIATRSSSTLRLQTLMSAAPIADSVQRLRTRMRDQTHGLKSIVDLAVLVALADDEIDEVELVALHETVAIVVGDVQTGLARHLINTCVASIREQGLEACARSVRDALVASDSLEDGLIVAYAAAFLSDGLSIPERGAIQALWEGTSIPYERVVQLRDSVRAAVDSVDAERD